LFIAVACFFAACTEVHHHHYGTEAVPSEEEPVSTEDPDPPLAVPANVSESPRVEPVESPSEPIDLVILTLGTLEWGDDELAHSFNEALRRAAAANPSINLNWRRVSLSQMMVVHHCAVYDPGCLHSMAQTLRASNLLVGTMHRRASVDGYELVVEMARYDSARRSVIRTHDVILPRFPSHELITREAFQTIHELFPSTSRPVEREASGTTQFVSL
jgi:hypothetical protein